MSEQEFEVYLRLIAKLLRLSDAQREAISDELRDHMESRLDELSSQGIESSEAIHTALSEFGDANTLVRKLLEVNQLKTRRRIMRTTVGTLAACAAVTFVVMTLTPTNKDGQPTQQSAIAQGDEHSQILDELKQLREENNTLRQNLSIITGSQMKELAVAIVIWSEGEDHDSTELKKPSDLREMIGFQSFLAPYDTAAYLESMQMSDDFDVWAWTDENSSYILRGGACYDPESILLEQRKEFIPGHRWVVYGDGHAELVAWEPETE